VPERSFGKDTARWNAATEEGLVQLLCEVVTQRSARRRWLRVFSGMLIPALVPACSSTVAPVARITRSIDLNYAQPRVLVPGGETNERVRNSFARVGVLADSVQNANLFIEVRLGASRGAGSCGPLHNVTYVIWHESRVVGSVKARGPIGDCAENILDQMTRATLDLVR
jgi:hypothetical protein